MRALFCLLVLGCTAVRVPPLAPTLAERRAAILNREVAWMDTLPVLRFSTPYVYGSWRLQVEQCSGLTRNGWPTFYISAIAPLPQKRDALFAARADAIVFALGQESRPLTVIHELLHWLSESQIAPAPDDETEEEMDRRWHPDSLYGPVGKCWHLIKPTS